MSLEKDLDHGNITVSGKTRFAYWHIEKGIGKYTDKEQSPRKRIIILKDGEWIDGAWLDETLSIPKYREGEYVLLPNGINARITSMWNNRLMVGPWVDNDWEYHVSYPGEGLGGALNWHENDLRTTKEQTNSDYLALPRHLWDVYRNGQNQIFHYPSGEELDAVENAEILRAWQECQVRSGKASWNAVPCAECGKSVCTCQANPEADFHLPPDDEEPLEGDAPTPERKVRTNPPPRGPRPKGQRGPRPQGERGPRPQSERTSK